MLRLEINMCNAASESLFPHSLMLLYMYVHRERADALGIRTVSNYFFASHSIFALNGFGFWAVYVSTYIICTGNTAPFNYQ